MENKKVLTKENCICFAYFSENKFIGWYSDSFGTITKQSPKIYQYSRAQIDTVTKNFRYMYSQRNKKSDLAEKVGQPDLSILDNGINAHSKKLNEHKQIELRIVECPHYDGTNPNFDKVVHQNYVEQRKQKMTEAGIFELFGTERTKAIEEFDQTYPKEENNAWWIYADRVKVREWASAEPTEFIETIPAKANGMECLGDRNYALLKMAIKQTGTFNPDECLPVVFEELYVNEYEEIKEFLQWVHETKQSFGSGNYEEVFYQFKKVKSNNDLIENL